MKKINLTKYKIQVPVNGKLEEGDFDVKNSLITIMFNPMLQLNGVELLKQNKIADKIDVATDEVILEDAEYEKVKNAVEKFQGLERNHVEFVKRVLEAEDYQLPN